MKKIIWYKDPEIGDLQEDKKYRERHRKKKRFSFCQTLVNSWECQSICDVGCKSMGFVEDLQKSYIRRVQTDYNIPGYLTKNKDISFFQTSLIDGKLKETFDVVTCFEVLEHIEPDKRRLFAEKLIEISKKHLLVSIPYNWKNSKELHPHDGYNESNLLEWFYPYLPDETFVIDETLIAHYIFEEENGL